MGITEYAFITYIFILLCVGMWLFGKFIRPVNKKNSVKNNADYEKEQKLFNLYQNIEDMLAGFEEFAEESREEINKNKTEIAGMIEQVKSIFEANKTSGEKNETPPKPEVLDTLKTVSKAKALYKSVADVAAPPNDIKGAGADRENVKETFAQIQEKEMRSLDANGLTSLERVQLKIPDKVAELCAEGLNSNDIAQRLGISIREVALAMKIRNVQ